ncbi:MAG TPA: hypothetical protein VFP39_02595 [Gemmatimonadales bacterium]|nr:hypothetical protein [Gemmatimonadales bacterium]
MSALLDAIAGIANASEPVAGLVTGGQPTARHLAALRQAGCELILDCRDPMEPRPLSEADEVKRAGMEYVVIPVGHTRGDDETLRRIREVLTSNVGKKKMLYHCASGNRVAATLIPYLMLDQDFTEAEAVETAMRAGARNAELIEWAVEFAAKRPAGG